MQESSIKKRYITKLLANVISGVIGAILIAIVPRALGPTAYGYFVYLQEFFINVINFLDMGSSSAFFTKLSAKHTRKELLTFYFFYSLIVLLLLLVFVGVVDFLEYSESFLPEIQNEYIYMGLFFGFFTWLTGVFVKVSDAYALTVSVELIKIGHKIISLLVILYFVYFTAFNLTNYFYIQYILFLSFLAILGWLFFKRNIFKGLKLLLSKKQFLIILREFVNYCHPLALYGLISFIASLLSIWMLQKYGGTEQTGFYGLAYSLAGVCFLFVSAMTQIITREFSKAYGKNDIEKMKQLFKKYIPMFYAIATYFSIFVFMQSDNIIDIFTGTQFKEVVLVLSTMAFYPIHQTYGQLSSSVFYATGQTKLYRNIGFLSKTILLLLSYIFIVVLNYGAVGLAFAMLIMQFVSVNVGLYFNTKFLALSIKYFIFHQFGTIVFFIIIAYMSNIIVISQSALYDFLLSGFVYTLLVILVGYFIPQVFAITRQEIHSNLIYLYNKIFK